MTRQFNNCSSLKELDCVNIIYINHTGNAGTVNSPYQYFAYCQNLTKLNLKNLVDIGTSYSINASRSWFYHCSSLKRLILPNVVNVHQLSDGFSNDASFTLTMLDVGDKCQTIKISKVNTITGILIMRGKPATIESGIAWPTKIFVPSLYLEQYKEATTWVNAESKIFPIGGTEWVELYGTTNEYANLTEEEYQDNYA